MTNIIDPEGLVTAFVGEWSSPSEYVTAHTSGSTGKPKEIHLLKTDMLRSARATCRFFGIGTGSVLHLPLSADYIAGKMMVVRALVSGATLIVERPSMSPLASFPEDIGQIDLTAVVPAQAEGLLTSGNIARVRNVIVGGGRVAAEDETKMRESAPTTSWWATYGMTETCSHVALRDISCGRESYRALPGIRFSVDGRGCLAIEGDGYSFGKLVTNDIVLLRSADEFVWQGRFDNVINSGGLKLHPEEMERMIEDIMPVPFYIVGRPSSRWGEEAVVVAENLDEDDCCALYKKIHSRFRRGYAPRGVVSVDKFRYTSTGKMLRLPPGDYMTEV